MRVREKAFSRDAVTYSDPIYGAIRSAKHSGFSVYHHLEDMKRVRFFMICSVTVSAMIPVKRNQS